MKKEEEDARLLDRCEAKRKAWAKQWQCDEQCAEHGGQALEKFGVEGIGGSSAKAEKVRFGEGVWIVKSKKQE